MPKNRYTPFETILRVQKGEDIKDIEKYMEIEGREIAKEPGKEFGSCESCGMETVLVKEVGLCGPCCFGEVETINGNF